MLGNIGQDMLMILAIDPSAVVVFSEFTHKWYVQSRIQISRVSTLTGITEHREGFSDAITSFLARMKAVGPEEALVIEACGERRYYRWNGAAFGMVMSQARTP